MNLDEIHKQHIDENGYEIAVKTGAAMQGVMENLPENITITNLTVNVYAPSGGGAKVVIGDDHND